MANTAFNHRDPDYCERCGGECVADCAATTCSACGGHLALVGRLGNLLHYCCRHCGAWFNRKAEEGDLE